MSQRTTWWPRASPMPRRRLSQSPSESRYLSSACLRSCGHFTLSMTMPKTHPMTANSIRVVLTFSTEIVEKLVKKAYFRPCYSFEKSLLQQFAHDLSSSCYGWFEPQRSGELFRSSRICSFRSRNSYADGSTTRGRD